MFEKVIQTIKKYRMLERGDHIVVGVSGGADSVCLLHVLHAMQGRWSLRLTVAHLDHMLRGEQSRREAEFVRNLAQNLGVPCVVEHREVRGCQREQGLSLQEAARRVRYEFLMEVLGRCEAQRIALGHNADDQAETVLMRILRGAALAGLGGIPPVRDGLIIRPLIDVPRKQIESYLARKKIDFVDDTSADEQHYLRNRIRHHLLPLLKGEYNPQIVAVLGRTAHALHRDNRVLEKLAAREVEACLTKDGEEWRCALVRLTSADPLLLPGIIRNIIERVRGDVRSVAFNHIDAVCGLIDRPGSSRIVQLPGGWCARREYDALVFSRQQPPGTVYQYCFDAIPDNIDIPEIGRSIVFTVDKPPSDLSELAARSGSIACIDYAKADMPMTVRNWLPGDRFRPLGLRGTKKLQDFFTDSRLPRPQRSRVPVLLFHNRIAWVCGIRIDDRFKVRSDTTTVLSMRLV